MRVLDLKAWLRQTPYAVPYLAYRRKRDIVRWIEQHVADLPPQPCCPTCGRLL
jgi:hypothetical protein